MQVVIPRCLCALVGATIWLAGCSPSQKSVRMIQFCLAGRQEIGSFTSFMDAIAQECLMEFTDRSGATEADLHELGGKAPIAHPLVDIGADRNREFSFVADNLGMPAEQIVVGFYGTEPDEVRQFADAVVRKLSSRWHVHEVPKGRGALPLSKCD